MGHFSFKEKNNDNIRKVAENIIKWMSINADNKVAFEKISCARIVSVYNVLIPVIANNIFVWIFVSFEPVSLQNIII